MTNHRTTNLRTRPRARRGGFTLLEITVALVAILVVALGLATIFDSVGKTVAAGRRVGRLNQYAALLEQQLRSDFARMTRDGVLVVRQQFADVDGNRTFTPAGDRVQVWENDERPRPRRVDEVLFFARGDFESIRSSVPAADAWAARAQEAAIYYGHGMETLDTGSASIPPKVNDMNNVAGTAANVPVLGRAIADNPQRYGRDWSLVRRAVLLVPPGAAPERLPLLSGSVYDANVGSPAGQSLLRDKEMQVAGRPASPVFSRALSRAFLGGSANWPSPGTQPVFALNEQFWRADAMTLGSNYLQVTNATNAFAPVPVVASGLVDIATTSLGEISEQVQGFAFVDTTLGAEGRLPGNYLQSPSAPRPSRTLSPTVATGTWPQRPAPASAFESVDFVHAWMDDLMPTRNIDEASQFGIDEGPLANPDTRGVRIRTARQAPDLARLLRSEPANAAEARQLAQLQIDANTLTASNLVVGCTEFAVDWSFGQTKRGATLPLLDGGPPLGRPDGVLLWYGPANYGSGTNPPPVWAATAGFYRRPAITALNGAADLSLATGSVQRTIVRNDGTTPINNEANAQRFISERVIYGWSPMDAVTLPSGQPAPGPLPLSVTSYFGFVDPTFDPDLDGTPGLDGPTDARDRVQPWPWPTLVRVRVTIADPVEPQFEGTFEFVFEVPTPVQ